MKNIGSFERAAARLLQLFPELTVTAALAQADGRLRDGDLASAAMWARAAALLSEAEAIDGRAFQVVA